MGTPKWLSDPAGNEPKFSDRAGNKFAELCSRSYSTTRRDGEDLVRWVLHHNPALAEIERLNLELAQGKFREGATCCYCSHSGAKMLAEIECLRANERRLVCDLARAIKDLAAAKAAKGE